MKRKISLAKYKPISRRKIYLISLRGLGPGNYLLKLSFGAYRHSTRYMEVNIGLYYILRAYRLIRLVHKISWTEIWKTNQEQGK